MRPNDTYFKLCQETGQIAWSDLTRFFAQGVVLVVADGLDLPGVGTALADDDTQKVAQWKTAGELAAVSDDTARRWFEADAQVWAVTVPPFILVQENRGNE
ncbi:MAG: DUF2288 domain-containing protein [Gammaproteobacteria bacterium]